MTSSPPHLTRALLRHLLPAEAAETLVGDLDEEFSRYVVPELGRLRANWWYRSQALRTVWNLSRSSRRRPGPAGESLVAALATDGKQALRSLRREPGFACLLLGTLGLGIGATTAIFSTVNEVLLRPLDFENPDRLVMLWESNAQRG